MRSASRKADYEQKDKVSQKNPESSTMSAGQRQGTQSMVLLPRQTKTLSVKDHTPCHDLRDNRSFGDATTEAQLLSVSKRFKPSFKWRDLSTEEKRRIHSRRIRIAGMKHQLRENCPGIMNERKSEGELTMKLNKMLNRKKHRSVC